MHRIEKDVAARVGHHAISSFFYCVSFAKHASVENMSVKFNRVLLRSLVLVFCITTLGNYVMAATGSLKAYRARRDFRKTSEPRGRKVLKKSKRPIFVIQKHVARSLHYDFRIEIDGVLKSWALPKGPSINPRDKRLAVPTEDHPKAYARFEGMIPKGEYGAGTVLVWDIGTYKNIKKKKDTLISMKQCLKNGQIEVFLKGKKLQGAFALIRTGSKTGERWLLIKMRDEYADARRKPVKSQPKSALTDRTLSQIKKDAEKKKKK